MTWSDLLERHITVVMMHDRYGTRQKKPVRFIQEWRLDPHRRVMDRLDFVPPPLACPPQVENLWKGFAAMHIPPAEQSVDIRIILQHIFYIAGGQGQLDYEFKPFKYIVSWLAHMFQRPGEIVGVMLALYSSRQGVGKSWLIEYLLTTLLGRQLVFVTAKADDVFGRFAGPNLMNKIVVNLDEANGSDIYKHAGMLKAMCTQKELTVEKKGVDTMAVMNFIRYIFTTNDAGAVPVEQSDRRVAYFNANCEIANVEHYHKHLRNTVESPQLMRATYDFFMSWDISD